MSTIQETRTEVDYVGNATYSPEDNKLRLYPFARLDRETYDRVKAEGFIWAPKQELFVAPMWTPGREDILNALCGEVGDEDKSLVERAEERAERFGEYSDSRADDARAAREGVAAIADNIPLGQPILVGHHSERHARKDAERIETGMRRAVKMWETAKYWESRAAGAVRSAKYKELPAVRARRIKKIEAEKRKLERSKAAHESAIQFWSGKFNLKKGEEITPLLINEDNRETVARILGSSEFGWLPVMEHQTPGASYVSHWSAFYVLRSDEDRYKECPAMTVPEVQTIALAYYPKLIANCDRWLAHYENRLAYERTMLAADGGTATDKVRPEVGGACKCWASPRGGWSIIQKVNKVSVTVLDNWGNDGADFTRTIEFDKLSSLWTKAQVDQARADSRLYLETKRGFHLLDEKPKNVQQPKDLSAEDKEFQALRETAKAGVQVVSASQLFPTPTDIAKQAVELADIRPTDHVLEPSAGTGVLTHAIFNAQVARLVAVEINAKLVEHLKAAQAFLPERESNSVVHADFLACNGNLGKFDRIVMNPPFENGSDIKHIEHALGFLNPGGKLVAICANGPRQREKFEPIADAWIDLPDGSFKEQGTNVRTAIVVISS